jgi:hypothetical protein
MLATRSAGQASGVVGGSLPKSFPLSFVPRDAVWSPTRAVTASAAFRSRGQRAADDQRRRGRRSGFDLIDERTQAQLRDLVEHAGDDLVALIDETIVDEV